VNKHHTKLNGDIAVAKTIVDLMAKGYFVGTMMHEHLPFDLVAYKNKEFFRIQVKYRSKGFVSNSCVSANGYKKFYDKLDFDYYAIYLPEPDKVVYPNIKYGGITIRYDIPNSATEFYWYDDFLDFTDKAVKRTVKDFNKKISRHTSRGISKPGTWIVERPTKEKLKILLSIYPWVKIGEMYNVSDNAVRKWATYYGIDAKQYSHGKKKKQFRLKLKGKENGINL
jgi:PD-(D/E)XK endonuclease